MEILSKVIYGNTIAQWAAAGAIALLSFLVGRGVYWFFHHWLTDRVRRTQGEFDDRLVKILENPLSTLTTIGGIWVGLQFLDLPPAVVALIERALLLVALLLTARLLTCAYELVHCAILRPLAVRSPKPIDNLLLPILRTGTKLVLWIVTGLAGLQLLGIDVGTALASAGIAGIAIGLAAQDTLANLFAGVTVVLQGEISTGDLVQLEEITARVHRIGLRTTTLISVDENHKIVIPNQRLTEDLIRNIDERPNYAISDRLLLHCLMSSAQIRQALQIIEMAARDNEQVEDVRLSFQRIGDSGFEIEFVYWIKKWSPEKEGEFPGDLWKIARVTSEMNLAIVEQFEQCGIKLALPIQVGDPPKTDGTGVFEISPDWLQATSRLRSARRSREPDPQHLERRD